MHVASRLLRLASQLLQEVENLDLIATSVEQVSHLQTNNSIKLWRAEAGQQTEP